MTGDMFIPLDVIEEATSDIPLRVPGGGETGKIAEPVLVMGSGLSRPDKLVGKTIPCEGTLYQRLVQPLLLAALNVDPPDDLTTSGWWDQARTLED